MLFPKSLPSLSSLTLVACSLLAAVSVVPVGQRPEGGEREGQEERPVAQEEEELPAAEGEDEAEEPSAVVKAMIVLRNGQRALRGLLEDPVANRDVLIETLKSMQTATLTSFEGSATRAEEMDDEAYALFDLGYRQILHDLHGSLLTMEEAALNGDAEALAATYPELNASKKIGHRTYQTNWSGPRQRRR